jgi:hypothetical protein
LFYIVPAIIAYFGIRSQFKNEWKDLEPDAGALSMVFVPFLNIGYAIFIIMDRGIEMMESRPKKTNIKKDEFAKKFFKP